MTTYKQRQLTQKTYFKHFAKSVLIAGLAWNLAITAWKGSVLLNPVLGIVLLIGVYMLLACLASISKYSNDSEESFKAFDREFPDYVTVYKLDWRHFYGLSARQVKLAIKEALIEIRQTKEPEIDIPFLCLKLEKLKDTSIDFTIFKL